MAGAGRETASPVTTEIVRNGLIAITEEMKSNLMRTAYSMIIYEAQDFTVGLFDPAGNTVSIGIGLPMFTRGMSDVVKAMIVHYGAADSPERMEPGDVLITNDAYLTGSHLNHITLVVPIFDQGDLCGFSVCMAHWQDIGGALNIVSRDIFSEGLQVPILKIHRAGVLNRDLMAVIRMNVRIPERAMGDLNAQIAAVKSGARRFLDLVGRYGRNVVLDAIAAIMDRSEALARERVRSIPDGEYIAESYMDDDAVDLGKRVPIKVKVIVAGDAMTVDLSEVALQVKGFYNSGEAAGRACCEVAFKCLTSPTELPINEGSFRALNVILPKGTVVSAVKPAPMQRWMTYPMTVFLNGRNPNDGKLFLLLGGLTGGGWGAKNGEDGMSATICINDGDTHNSPVEQIEAKYPVVVERYALREDSGGAGQWQGGLGTERIVRAASEFNFNAQVERVFCRPWGLFGGHPGSGNQVAIRTNEAREVRLTGGKVQGRVLRAGEAYILRSGGGGGYGSPLDRPIGPVQHDLDEGYISTERAQGCYGVVIEAGRIDADRTAARRNALRARGGLIAQRDNEDEEAREADATATPKGLFFTEGLLFPLRCC